MTTIGYDRQDYTLMAGKIIHLWQGRLDTYDRQDYTLMTGKIIHWELKCCFNKYTWCYVGMCWAGSRPQCRNK